MTNKEAIVSIVDKITKKNTKPCKKTLQKIVYLIEIKGVDVGCDYGIHFYGPYSSDLDYAVRELNNENVLNIEYTDTEHRISVIDKSFAKGYSNKTVDFIIDKFAKDSPSDLELIATSLYVYSHVKDLKKVVSGVIKIKGSKYSESQIKAAIIRLKDTGYIS